MLGLNALVATLATASTAPIIVAQRLRKDACGSPRGANRLIDDAVKQARRLLPAGTAVLVRMDSAYWGRPSLHAAIRDGAKVSVTVKMSFTSKPRAGPGAVGGALDPGLQRRQEGCRRAGRSL